MSVDTASASGRRPSIYAGTNFAFLGLIATLAAIGGSDNPRLLYLLALFAICTTPILLVKRLNGPYAALTVCLSVILFSYGISDVIGLLGVRGLTLSEGILSDSEFAILLGVGLLVFGYRMALIGFNDGTGNLPARNSDWPEGTAILIGLFCWLVGVIATWFWQTNLEFRLDMATGAPSIWTTMATVLANYLHPLGLAILAYRFVRRRGPWMTLLIVIVLGSEFILGFVEDSKELAVRGLAIVVLTGLLVEGSVPRTWLLTAAIVAALSFPIFQGYRYVLHESGESRLQAASNLIENIEKAIDESKHSSNNEPLVSATGRLSFISRTSLKPTMEMIVGMTGHSVKYQDGHTIELFFAGMVPRAFWRDKPDTSVGQLFNRQYHAAEDPDTYISPTFLGELYWNYGWTGILLGMPVIGFLLGFANRLSSMSESRSLTRYLALTVTIYLICLRFEGGIALQFLQWFRSIVIVLVLHLIFARRSSPPAVMNTMHAETLAPAYAQARTFPNLMR